jgi:hypothetical protein
MAKVGGPMLRELYEHANRVVSDRSWPEPNRCPVCESKLTGPLSAHLRDRIAQYAAADAANVALATAVAQARSVSRLAKLEGAAVPAVPRPERLHGPLAQAATKHTLPTADLRDAFARLEALEANRAKAVADLDADRIGIEAKLPPSLVVLSKSSHSHASSAKRSRRTRPRWTDTPRSAQPWLCASDGSGSSSRLTRHSPGRRPNSRTIGSAESRTIIRRCLPTW